MRRSKRELSYFIQKHAASRLHYDFRLEHGGVLLSWAVPKGPSLDPAEKRLAVRVEDHPLEYGDFEGVIPEGQYGAGPVLVWDRGRWLPEGDVDEGLRTGKLEFQLQGEKLTGSWRLVRMRTGKAAGDDNWLLIKRRDEAAGPRGFDVTRKRPESVVSGRTLEEIGEEDSRRSRASRRSGDSPSAAAAALPQAAPGPLPRFVEPELATLVSEAPAGKDWLHEIKVDGYRMLARLDHGRVHWLSRNGHDWSARFAVLSADVQALPAKRALLDGEVVVLRPDGTTSFQDLQQAEGRTDRLTYIVFDLLHLDDLDLRAVPLLERKRVLHLLLEGARRSAGRRRRLRYSDHVLGEGPAFYREACRSALEGIISKQSNRPYRSGRTREWVKTKCAHQQEFVVAGFTEPAGSRVGIGALVLGVHENGRLRYAGRVGTGFDRTLLQRLRRELEPLRVSRTPFAEDLPAAARRGVNWVRPRLVVEVKFTGWTADGLLRHPSFEGLREDKPAEEVVREQPVSPTDGSAPASSRRTSGDSARVAGIAITHPDRVVYSAPGITKLELARFYERIAPRILPHVEERPLSVMRCPQGSEKECFFQKHAGEGFPDAIKSVEVEDSSGRSRYLMIDSVEGLIALVQMGVLELHPWSSRSDRLDRPDRMFFDLDPAPEVRWRRVADAALVLRDLLQGLDLTAFVKTTGGKGLHVLLPLTRKHGWDEVKTFAHAIAMRLALAEPKLYVATASKAQRKGRIFIDYLRNSRGATAVAPYSTRARPGAPVSTPIAWTELEGDVRSDTFTVKNLDQRLRILRRDPWEDFSRLAQTLNASARRRLGV